MIYYKFLTVAEGDGGGGVCMGGGESEGFGQSPKKYIFLCRLP